MTLTALALSGMLPAFGASPAPTITGYAAANRAAVPIASTAPGASLLILGAGLGTTPGTVAFAGPQPMERHTPHGGDEGPRQVQVQRNQRGERLG